VESVVDHVHLWDIFDPESDLQYQALSELAMRVSIMWRSAPTTAFPRRRFIVDTSDADNDYGPTLSFRSVSQQ